MRDSIITFLISSGVNPELSLTLDDTEPTLAEMLFSTTRYMITFPYKPGYMKYPVPFESSMLVVFLEDA